ncbi:LOW QUALITY PROTEIN: stabilizer of axonemal microtubules 1-like [Glossophaga mutica]
MYLAAVTGLQPGLPSQGPHVGKQQEELTVYQLGLWKEQAKQEPKVQDPTSQRYCENFSISKLFKLSKLFKGSKLSEIVRRDFGPHKALPVKVCQPDHFAPSKENMDLLTTYKQDYNPYPVCLVDPIKPRDSKYPCGGKMECLPTYKGRGLPCNQPRRELLHPEHNYWPESTRFDSRTTHQGDYSVKSLGSTMSCKPPVMSKVCNIPLEDLTNYKMSYVAHPMEKCFVLEVEKFRACEIPFESLTTHKQSYWDLKGEPAKSLKPPVRSCGLDTTFSNTMEFQDKFQVWPTPQVFSKPPVFYVPPEEKMDLLTTVQSHYMYPKGAPAQSCPVLRVKKGGHFESSTTTKDDYKQWASMCTALVKPVPQMNRPTEPLDCLTTTRAHYVPHPPINTKSCKPSWSGPANILMEGQTTYTINSTPKEMGMCLASCPEPPGYIFEETDASGHRIYRPISHSWQKSPLSSDDSENPNQQQFTNPTT